MKGVANQQFMFMQRYHSNLEQVGKYHHLVFQQNSYFTLLYSRVLSPPLLPLTPANPMKKKCSSSLACDEPTSNAAHSMCLIHFGSDETRYIRLGKVLLGGAEILDLALDSVNAIRKAYDNARQVVNLGRELLQG